MALIFQDGFENESFTRQNWSNLEPGNPWPLIHFSDEQVYEGIQSMYFESGPLIFKEFEPMSDAYIRFAFYDLMNHSGVPAHIHCRINDPSKGTQLCIGVEMEYSDNYVYRILNERNITSIPRSEGWHIFEIWINSNGVTIAIDGNIIIRDEPRITTFESMAFMSSPGPTYAYWDAVEVHSDTASPPNGNGPEPPIPEEMVKPLLIGGVVGLLLALSI